ncbi:MAG: hypothetical protein EZS28_044676, partial [Streblomastix strix]
SIISSIAKVFTVNPLLIDSSIVLETLEDDKLSVEISKAVLSRLGRMNQMKIAQKAADTQISDHSKGYEGSKTLELGKE